MRARRDIVLVGTAIAYLYDREIFVLEVESHARLILAVGRDGALHGSYEVGLDLETSPPGDGVVNGFHA